MSLLDRCPFDSGDPEARELLDALGHVYPQAGQAQRPISYAGIRLQDIALNDAMIDVWPRVLRAAANQGRLRALVTGISEDPNSAGYPIFARLADTPVETQSEARFPGSGRWRRRTVLWVLAAAVVVLALGIGTVLAWPDASPEGPGEIVLEEYRALGDHPFMPQDSAPSAGAPDPASFPVANTGAGAVTVDGAEPGVYGGERDVDSLWRDAVVAYYQQHPQPAVALVKALNSDPAVARGADGPLTVAGLASYLHALTPAVLRFDIRVTDHGLFDGAAVARQAVLQTGTAVLVDAFGVPRIRLASGSPLTAMQKVPGVPDYVGTKWNAFDDKAIGAMRPAGEPLTILILIDLRTGVAFERPVGSVGDRDAAAKSGPAPSSGAPPGSTTPAARPTPIVDSPTTVRSAAEPLDLSGTWAINSFGADMPGTVRQVAEGFAFHHEVVAGNITSTLDCVLTGTLGGDAIMNCRNGTIREDNPGSTDSSYSGTLTPITWAGRPKFRFDGVITAPISPSLGQYAVTLSPR